MNPKGFLGHFHIMGISSGYDVIEKFFRKKNNMFDCRFLRDFLTSKHDHSNQQYVSFEMICHMTCLWPALWPRNHQFDHFFGNFIRNSDSMFSYQEIRRYWLLVNFLTYLYFFCYFYIEIESRWSKASLIVRWLPRRVAVW